MSHSRHKSEQLIGAPELVSQLQEIYALGLQRFSFDFGSSSNGGARPLRVN